jgi:FixJ family two-component response regulator
MGDVPVLVVDDEPLVRRALRSMIDPVCPTVGAASLAQAAKHVTSPLTAVVIDVVLGKDSGWDVLALAREHDPLLPAMMVTGRDFVNLARKAFNSNAVAYEKPLEPEDIRRFVRDAATTRDGRLLHLRQLLRELGDGAGLSEAEQDVVEAFVRGMPRGTLQDGTKKIAMSTHKSHVSHICDKTRFVSLTALRDDLMRRYFKV